MPCTEEGVSFPLTDPSPRPPRSASLTPDAARLWDRWFKHALLLKERRVLSTEDLVQLFTPLLLERHATHSHQVASEAHTLMLGGSTHKQNVTRLRLLSQNRNENMYKQILRGVHVFISVSPPTKKLLFLFLCTFFVSEEICRWRSALCVCRLKPNLGCILIRSLHKLT